MSDNLLHHNPLHDNLPCTRCILHEEDLKICRNDIVNQMEVIRVLNEENKTLKKELVQERRNYDDTVLFFQEKINALQKKTDSLLTDVYKLIDSCWYRTTTKKIHWKQGRYFGTSIADYTTPEAYIEAIQSIRHNASLSPQEEDSNEQTDDQTKG